ncbi:MAG TPA: xanthine dehydrogenase family protein molybdopterin-binding subunit [Terriglobales bacterium]|nr:xanthine dehydrogenase family protein molybdopterin-binding subunit [Terriglobales bacterium]
MATQYIGASIGRREDFRLLTGEATFVDDVKLPGTLHAAILRSPHAHARIRAIDTRKALGRAGVVRVLEFKDIAAIAKPIPIRIYALAGLDRYLQFPLARDKVRHVGDPVALVIAETAYLAEDALEEIDITYEPLPAVVDVREALRDEVLLYEENGSNLAAHYKVSVGNMDQALRRAEYKRREEFKTQRLTGNPLETRGVLASYDSARDELTVWGPTKVAHYNRGLLASLLNLPQQKIHFIEPAVGGGFGVRGEFYPEDFLIPYAAMKLKRPVKWIEDRREHLLTANHSREIRCDIEVAATRDGTLLGLRARVFGDMGAYIRTHGGVVPAHVADLLPTPYRISNYECSVYFVMTNKTGTGTLRAPGRYESCFIMERLIDIVARDLGLSPVEIRQKNLIGPEEMPYTVGNTQPENKTTTLDSGNYPRALAQALEAFDYEKVKHLQGKYDQGKYHGIGIACFVKNTGRGPHEAARVVVGDQGDLEVYLGIASLGQGHRTVMAQICADALGVGLDRVTVYLGNTDYMPSGGGTYASRATVMGGNAIYLAARELKENILRIAAGQLETKPGDLELREGKIYLVDGNDRGESLMDLQDIVRVARAKGLVDRDPFRLDVTAKFTSLRHTFTYGAHVAHVKVDVETGQVEVLRYLALEDVGRAINPLLVRGQVVGAVAQGIGATLLEELTYNEEGQLLTTTLKDYLLPTSTDIPPIECVITEESPSSLNPLGIKGVGEGGIVATGAALANAVASALAPLGIEIVELPLTPNHLRAWIRSQSG